MSTTSSETPIRGFGRTIGTTVDRLNEALTAGQGGCNQQERSRTDVIRERFAYHPPTPEQAQRYAILRTDFTNLAVRIAELTPFGPDQKAALEQLHMAMMMANRAIALE